MHASTLSDQLKTYRPFLLFVFKLLVIWVSWKLIIHVLGIERTPINERMFPALSAVWEQLNDYLRLVVLFGTEQLLRFCGFEIENTGYFLRIKGNRGFGLGNYCLAIQLMYYFIMLIAISGLTVFRKIFAMLSGIVIVTMLNIFRFSALCYFIVFHPAWLKLSHEYLFNLFVLGVLFIYYLFLIRKSPDGL